MKLIYDIILNNNKEMFSIHHSILSSPFSNPQKLACPSKPNKIVHSNYLSVAVVAGMLLENVKIMRHNKQIRKGMRALHSGSQPLP